MQKFNGYYRGVSLAFTPLTAEDEQRLDARIKAGDEAARAELIQCHLRWAASMARRYRGRLDLEDAISAANEGMMEALKRWKSDKGQFAHYAYNFVKGGIFQAVARRTVVPTNVHVMTQRSQIRRARANNECPVEVLGLTPERVAEIDRAWGCDCGTPSDELVTAPETSLEGMDASLAVEALSCLPERAQHIMRYRFGLTPMPDGVYPSLIAVGLVMGLSRERVRQIEASSLLILRERLENEKTD